MTHFHELLIVAFMIGIGSTGHCLLMCGGISSALSSKLSQTSPKLKAIKLLLFHLGRISCYSLLGLVLGSALHFMISFSENVIVISRVIASLLIILVGLYIAGLSSLIRLLEQQLGFIWKHIQPITQRYIHMQKWHHAYILGLLWGFLPCGIIYSTLIWASANNQGLETALLMLSFGLGTLPALFVSNLLSIKAVEILQKKHFKRTVGLLLVGFGIWTIMMMTVPNNWFGEHQHTPEAAPLHQHHSL